MIYYHYIITAILAAILINFLINIILFRNIKNYSIPKDILPDPPLISVLVPARNEAENIYRCVISLARQDYKNIEILVLDDNSIDSTASIVKKMSEDDERIKLINGEPLKKGWLGKCWACFQLASHAKGDYFIFTDADTFHSRDTVSRSFAALLHYGLDAISVYPKQITVTFHERMTVPFINFAILSFMPLILVKYAKGGFFSTGIGQFFLFKRNTYVKMGGHQSVKTEILEDIHLSKQIKRSGFKYMVFDGSSNIFCRMYKNLAEVMQGFSKFIYSAFNYNIFAEVTALTAFSIFFLFPFILFPAGIMIFHWSGFLIIFNLIQILIIFVIKIILALRFKIRIIDIFFLPISICYMLIIAVNSYLQARFKKGVEWKGRTYSVEAENELELVEDSYDGADTS